MLEITDEQVQQFQRDGFLILERIIPDDAVRRAREAMGRIWRGEATHDRRPDALRKSLTRHDDDDTAVRHIVHGRLLDGDLLKITTSPEIGAAVGKLLGSASVSLTEDQLFQKPPHSPPIAMHQDYPYQTFATNDRLTTCWIALTDITPDSSPLEYIRGSHKWPVAAMPEKFANGEGEDDYMEVVGAVQPAGQDLERVPVIVPAGGGAFHYTMTMHGSRANRSDQPRCAMALHHAAEECRTKLGGLMWHASMWEGIEEGGPVANTFMPVVWPPQRVKAAAEA